MKESKQAQNPNRFAQSGLGFRANYGFQVWNLLWFGALRCRRWVCVREGSALAMAAMAVLRRPSLPVPVARGRFTLGGTRLASAATRVGVVGCGQTWAQLLGVQEFRNPQHP